MGSSTPLVFAVPARSISEVDQKLKYIIKNYERDNETAKLDRLLKEDYNLDKTKLEIGVIDSSGFMIARNTHSGHLEPIYLGDRDYFSSHINGNKDLLFIWRASGWLAEIEKKWLNRNTPWVMGTHNIYKERR
ncbi:MAG: hypothetical protein WAN43_03015 [Rhodomicrobium sp.]